MLMLRLRGAADGLRRHGTWLALEFVVVVTGLTLSLLLQDRAQALQREASERRLLGALRDDLLADTRDMERRIAAIDRLVEFHTLLLDPARREAATPAELDAAVDGVITYLGFASRDVTYRTLDASTIAGSEHREVFRAAITLYTGAYRSAQEWAEIDKHLVLERMIPFLDDHAPHVPRGANPLDPAGLHQTVPALVGQPRFLNLLTTARLFKTGLRMSIEIARKAALELLEQLEPFRAAS